MSTQALSLPVNVAWTRTAAPADMYDDPDYTYPPKYRSSAVIFHHVVPEEETQEDYPGRRIVFVKVSLSLTGYKPTEDIIPAVLQAGPGIVNKYWFGTREWIRWRLERAKLERYYPCVGSICQISAFSQPESYDPDCGPYIMDVIPKKRELLEQAVRGEDVLEASTSSVGVSKTNSEGSAFGWEYNPMPATSFQYAGFGGSAGKQLGFTGSSTAQDTIVTTRDWSREKREGLSYQTTLSHVYQILNTYHVGTNRVMCVISPRPHAMEADFDDNGVNRRAINALINGRRWLEGVQDFLLIVNAPADLEGLSVRVRLNTGHPELDSFNKYESTDAWGFAGMFESHTHPLGFGDLVNPLGYAVEKTREWLFGGEDPQIPSPPSETPSPDLPGDRASLPSYDYLFITERILEGRIRFDDPKACLPPIRRYPDVVIGEELIPGLGLIAQNVVVGGTNTLDSYLLAQNTYYKGALNVMLGTADSPAFRLGVQGRGVDFSETALYQAAVANYFASLPQDHPHNLSLDQFFARAELPESVMNRLRRARIRDVRSLFRTRMRELGRLGCSPEELMTIWGSLSNTVTPSEKARRERDDRRRQGKTSRKKSRQGQNSE